MGEDLRYLCYTLLAFRAEFHGVVSFFWWDGAFKVDHSHGSQAHKTEMCVHMYMLMHTQMWSQRAKAWRSSTEGVFSTDNGHDATNTSGQMPLCLGHICVTICGHFALSYSHYSEHIWVYLLELRMHQVWICSRVSHLLHYVTSHSAVFSFPVALLCRFLHGPEVSRLGDVSKTLTKKDARYTNLCV